MEQELVQAILIASDPTQVSLHQQALEYLGNVQSNAANTWRLGLEIFVATNPDGSRRHPPQARFFALRLLDEFLDNRFDLLDLDSFQTLQQALLSYIQSEYVFGSAEADAGFLRNKFSHTLTLFFLCTYMDQWTTFFADLFTLIKPADASTYNRHVSLLFFHLMLEISGEVADNMIKTARNFDIARNSRDGRVRDAVRERDAATINEAVLTIIINGVEKMASLRKADSTSETQSDLGEIVEIVDWGVRTFGSYVGWIDINLTVTPTTVPLLFNLLSDVSLPIRLATSVALLRILSKGLKEPGDKLHLIEVLSLGQVIDALEAKTRAQQAERGKDVDEGEESYREALGRLLNALGLELSKLVEDPSDGTVTQAANKLLENILPVMLRFMADEYDDTCSTIFPLLQTILAAYKRGRKISTEPIDSSKRDFLASLLKVTLEKMKWEEETDPEDEDEDDNAAFDGLRKDLRGFIDSVFIIDQGLVTETVRTFTINTLSAYREGTPIKWHDAELAVYLVYIFGEINKSGGKGRSAFCQAPALVKEQRKSADYSEYPLTVHGEMLFALVQSGVSSYPHRIVAMQFFETAARYGDFFKVRKECILPTLQAMIDPRGLHNQNSSVRSRVYYLFHRFIKDIRGDIPVDIAISIIDGMRDLLDIHIEMPELEDASQNDVLNDAILNPGLFDSQVYLFETAGVLVSLMSKTPEQQPSVLQSLVKPLLDDLSTNLQLEIKSPQDVLPVLKVHHIILALGNIAKGFPDYPSPPPENFAFPPLDVLGQIAQAILICLEAMNVYKVVRDATRFAFARILATTGPNVTHLVPALMGNLLTHFEPAELVDFISFIGLLLHKLQQDMFEVLDQLIGPLTSHINGFLSQPATGTDEAVAHAETKRAYFNFLNNILAAKLQGVFISERNKGTLEAMLEAMRRQVEDVTEPSSQKAALIFLSKCVAIWGQPVQGNGVDATERLPGFERFIYEGLVPSTFSVLSLPQLNIKDGQILTVLNEIANFLHVVCRTRGAEAQEYLLSVFLPSQNWPPETAIEFVQKLSNLDGKTFRKYFTDFVRNSRS